MGWNLRETLPAVRKARGLTQEKLGELARITRTDIVAFETGKKDVGAERLQRIAEALGVSRLELVPESAPDQKALLLQDRLESVEAEVVKVLSRLRRLADQVDEQGVRVDDLSGRVSGLEDQAPPQTRRRRSK
jgi:transcriptional regulator with XRE-family HTH domain